jgi:hypothetical protein
LPEISNAKISISEGGRNVSEIQIKLEPLSEGKAASQPTRTGAAMSRWLCENTPHWRTPERTG